MLKPSDVIKFDNLVSMCAVNGRVNSGIGTYSEKSLHFVLKNFFECESDYHEVAYKGFIADVMHGDSITEIQTSTLNGMQKKLDAFLEEKTVRIVYPLIKKKTIIWIDSDTGETERSDKSIKYETDYTLLGQLFYISEYLRDPALTVTVVDVEADDYREVSGNSPYRKKRAKKVDIVPTKLLDVRDLVFPDDVISLIPQSLPMPFTRDELSRSVHLRGRDLWAALKLLEALRLIERTEPRGRKHQYMKLT